MNTPVNIHTFEFDVIKSNKKGILSFNLSARDKFNG